LDWFIVSERYKENLNSKIEHVNQSKYINIINIVKNLYINWAISEFVSFAFISKEVVTLILIINEPHHDKTNILRLQPGHPRSLIRIHAVRYQFLYLYYGL
jgi:hypothetical protein